jgi:hypothetical protein
MFQNFVCIIRKIATISQEQDHVEPGIQPDVLFLRGLNAMFQQRRGFQKSPAAGPDAIIKRSFQWFLQRCKETD